MNGKNILKRMVKKYIIVLEELVEGLTSKLEESSYDKIEQLKRAIAEEEKNISNCKHSFNDPIYDPETVKEGYGSIQDGAGSDPHWSYAGYNDVKKDRWSRKCTNCGHKEYTHKQEAVISSYKPKF